MESIFGMESMAKEAAVVRMIQAHEKEILETARISNMVRQSRPIHPAWYCPLLVHLGDMMVILGTHLKMRYSMHHALRVR
jgi:hypothetical protein